MKTLSFSHIGKRKVNQDFVLIEELGQGTQLALIADGMGGYDHGDIAAKMVAENIMAFLSTVHQIEPSGIQMAVNKANLAVKQLKELHQTKLGATVAGIILQGEKAICFWVGDVKIFHFKNLDLEWESTPHSLVNEVLSSGSIKDPKQIEKYRHVVTRSVQGDIEKSIISSQIINDLTSSDQFIICSDGVSDYFEGLQIQQLLKNSTSALKEIEDRLSIEAKDNFSLISLSNISQ